MNAVVPVGLRAPAGNRRYRVLLVSLFHPELIRGGAQQIAYELFKGLQDEPDMEPVLLASVDSTYPELFKPGARITGFDGRPNEFLFLSSDYDFLWHRIASPLHVSAFAEFLETVQPDVVHFHHFMTLGVDLLSLTRRVLPNCRIVLTFHEFLAICDAAGHMVRRTDQSLCDWPSPVRCHQCFPERAPEHFVARKMWFQRHLSVVDAFTCPSRFMIQHYVDWGIDRERLFHVTNGQMHHGRAARPSDRGGPRNRFGFFGQLLDIKGIRVLMQAITLLREQGFTDFAVELNGDNLRYASKPTQSELAAFLEREESRAPRIVYNNGSYQVDQLGVRMSRIDWSVVPSVWREAFGLVVSEAWMFGRPVICSDVGALAERVTDEVDGLHFRMGDAADLARTMRRACTEQGLWERLSGALPDPPSRAEMIAGYRHAYNTV
jgi:glycosyltransferase involved in cell wall biosynthesis